MYPSSPPDTVCILRLSAIGDVVNVLPVVRTLRKVWPDTKITWVVGSLEAQLLEGLDDVEIISFDKKSTWASCNRLRQYLGSRKFDVLLHMQVSLRASLASLCIRAKVRVGFDRKRAADYQWLFTNHKIASVPRQHVLEGFFEFPKALGIDERVLHWSIPIPESARDFVDKAIPDNHRQVLVINPCSSQRRNNWRNWAVQRYAQVIEYGLHRYSLTIVLTGGPVALEIEMAKKIIRLLPEELRAKVINLVGMTSLKQLCAVLERADALIAPDTGPAHIANAMGKPVIGLYATSNPDRTGPYNRQWVVNRYGEAMRQSGIDIEQAKWGMRVRDSKALELIQVSDVTDKLDQLFRVC